MIVLTHTIQKIDDGIFLPRNGRFCRYKSVVDADVVGKSEPSFFGSFSL